ncbi:MAG: ankyrin repeat domain-containing protein [Rickettsia endosymbiont of Argas persicus]
MKKLWNLSWSKYSWAEIRKILIALPRLLFLNGNANILDISIETSDIELIKKILETEKISNINEPNNDGLTALHIASLQGKLEIVKFLVEEKNADIHIKTPEKEFYYQTPELISRLIKGNSSIIDFSVEDLDSNMTKYFLELGLEMPQVITIFIGVKTGEEFCKQLCDYFEEKVEQNPTDINFDSILKQVKNAQKNFHENILNPFRENLAKHHSNEKIEVVVKKEKVDDDATDLIGEENV